MTSTISIHLSLCDLWILIDVTLIFNLIFKNRVIQVIRVEIRTWIWGTYLSHLLSRMGPESQNCFILWRKCSVTKSKISLWRGVPHLLMYAFTHLITSLTVLQMGSSDRTFSCDHLVEFNLSHTHRVCLSPRQMWWLRLGSDFWWVLEVCPNRSRLLWDDRVGHCGADSTDPSTDFCSSGHRFCRDRPQVPNL